MNPTAPSPSPTSKAEHRLGLQSMMRRARLIACVVLSTVLACAVVAASGEAAPLVFAQCSTTQVVAPVSGLQCARLSVPLDRGDPASGSIALAVQRVAASTPKMGTIVLLAGGPGQPALPFFEEMLAPLARMPALNGFELVAFDQRGTGQSGALKCPQVREPKSESELSSFLGRCGVAIGASRGDYSSQESVEDLDAL